MTHRAGPIGFPSEEAQKKERQRLFDILGRITIETDRKGNQKQVVRGCTRCLGQFALNS